MEEGSKSRKSLAKIRGDGLFFREEGVEGRLLDFLARVVAAVIGGQDGGVAIWRRFGVSFGISLRAKRSQAVGELVKSEILRSFPKPTPCALLPFSFTVLPTSTALPMSNSDLLPFTSPKQQTVP